MSASTLRFCKDCRWFQPADAGPPTCAHPSSVFVPGIDLVTGETPAPVPMTCAQARLLMADPRDGYCGREGVHWGPGETGFGDP